MSRRALESAICVGLLILLVSGLTATPARAGRSQFGASWNLAMPMGNTRDFTRPLSARGFTLEWHNFIRKSTSWGINAGWTVFNENADNTTYGDGWAVSGDRWNYINAVPIYASGFHYWGDRRDTNYFAGANLGTVWSEYRTTVGLYEFKESVWHLAVAPEIGIRMPLNSFLGYLSLRYNLLMKSGDIDTQSWLELRVGFGR